MQTPLRKNLSFKVYELADFSNTSRKIFLLAYIFVVYLKHFLLNILHNNMFIVFAVNLRLRLAVMLI